MSEDDLSSIGILRRRVNDLEATLADFGRRLAIVETSRRRDETSPPRAPLRGTGSLRDPDLVAAEQRRQQAYEEGNAAHPLPISGTSEVDEPKED